MIVEPSKNISLTFYSHQTAIKNSLGLSWAHEAFIRANTFAKISVPLLVPFAFFWFGIDASTFTTRCIETLVFVAFWLR
jgi:hypothetical protein